MSGESIRPTVLGADGRPVPAGMADAPAKPPRRRRAWDIALAVLFLLLTFVVGFIGMIFAFLSLAFIDNCVGDCSIDGAVGAQFLAAIAVLLTVVAGVIATIVLIVARRRVWWVAMLTFLLVVAEWTVGLVLWDVVLTQ